MRGRVADFDIFCSISKVHDKSNLQALILLLGKLVDLDAVLELLSKTELGQIQFCYGVFKDVEPVSKK